MFRIRRVFDDVLPLNRAEIAAVQQIMREQFPGVRDSEITGLPARLRNPLKYRFRSLLFVADDAQGHVRGFALLSHEPNLHFTYLDYIAAARALTSAGIGGALYERVRDEARALHSVGLFFECLPDVAEEVTDPAILKANTARLRFYERFGARPLDNTAYRDPIKPGERGLPHLVFDDLGTGKPLRRDHARAIIRAILERKYGHLCPPAYVTHVVDSVQDDPVRLRPPRYVRAAVANHASHAPPADRRIALVINADHDIHHVRERGYVEAPVRIRAILHELEPTGLCERLPPRDFGEQHLRAVHDGAFVDYLKRVCAEVPPGRSVYPYVFPIRNATRPPKALPIRAGYYCIDTFTPINRNAYLAARRAVDCSLTAARQILGGYRLAYALVRPPGHHAERRSFGGFCYFNSAAVAAEYLSVHGKVAILDIDYHHGNGQQNIFYERADVLTVSIHGHPNFAYPYFSGFEGEEGAGPGKGYNVNIPLPENVSNERYLNVLGRALGRVARFRPKFLIVTLGLDTAKEDPTGSWSLQGEDFQTIGKMIGSLHYPTIVVQEGGYDTRVRGINARHFFEGLWTGSFTLPPRSGRKKPAME